MIHHTLTSETFELSPFETVSYVEDRLAVPDTEWHVAVERFTIQRNVQTPQLDAIETNGALRYVTARCNATFELQGRGEAKKVVTDVLLHSLGCYTRTKDGHANDGWRHALLWMLIHRPVEYMLLTDGL